MRRLAPLFLLCLSIDFTNPMLPGSVRFDPSESVEATHASPYHEVDGWGRPAGEPARVRVLPTERLRSTPPVAVSPVSALRSRPPTARHRPRESDARASASATEDH
jgi:hypothetical protein